MTHTKYMLLLLTVIFFTTSCEKGILGKKSDTPAVIAPEAKYYGTWKADRIAQDLNGNNSIDANEYYTFTGTSVLNLNSDKKFSFSLTTNTGSSTMSGDWTTTADIKSVTITDAAQGSLRFDYRTDTEIQTEPIALNPGVAWIIYKKQ
jgi:hypothetical protein